MTNLAEEKRNKRLKDIAFLTGEFYLQKTSPLVYCLTAKYGRTNKAFFRFFAVVDNHIEDITTRVARITEFPLRDCKLYWAIYTHSTNAQDIIQELSKVLYQGGCDPRINAYNIIRMEKL